ncbi:A-kinase anchor protein 10, mitochondrial-like [Antedon mediterranea]|uniref:A-kinase anchor protein 10, mitochondrial-like n=1 Tax=Antedon mediterranea TaxID=105859 RepID=UPI003AF4B180
MPLFRRKSEKKPENVPHKNRHQESGGLSKGHTQLPNGENLGAINEKRASINSNVVPGGGGIPRQNPLVRKKSDDESKYGDLGSGTTTRKSEIVAKSRLSRTLNEVLNDNGALPYFIQYMSSQKCGHLVRFWLAVESFSRASWSRIRTESINRLKTSLTNNSSSVTSPTNCANIVISSPTENPAKMIPNETMNNNSNVSDTTSRPIEGKGVSSVLLHEKTHTRSKSDSVVGLAKLVEKSEDAAAGDVQCAKDTNSLQKNQTKFQDPRTPIERDAMNIYTTYLCKDAPYPVGIGEEMRLQVIAKICPENDQPDPKSFGPAHQFVYEALETIYFPAFMSSEFHAKYQVDILTSGKVYLADILFNDTAMFHFMEYMEQEKCLNLLQFYLAADNFQQQLLTQEGQYDGMEAQSDAMVLYDKYFSLQATDPLGFSDNVRLEVESNICREEGPLPDCFATAKQQALMTIESVHFPGFLTSDLYYLFLSELVNQIKSEIKVPSSDTSTHPSNTSGAGQSTTDQSANKNTLLAEGKVKTLFEMNDFTIDSGVLNPSSLWTRPNQSPMSFGTVNSLGQFVAEYEPDPEVAQHKAKGKFSLRKLVTKEEDKTKEDMAWKVAQMIIKDVNMQTHNTGVGFPSAPDS